MMWSTWAGNRLVPLAVIDDAVNTGELVRTGQDIVDPNPQRCHPWVLLQDYIKLQAGHPATAFVPTKDQIIAWRDLTVTGFDLAGSQDFGACPTLRVNLTWDNKGNNSTKTLRWRAPAGSGSWTVLSSSISGSATSFQHNGATDGVNNEYWLEAQSGSPEEDFTTVFVSECPT